MLLASACARSRSVEPEVGDTQAVEEHVPQAQQVTEANPVADNQPVDDQPAAIESSDFLAYRAARRLLPDDAMIGPLADDLNATASERTVLRAAERLLAAVQSGDPHDLPLSAKGRVHVAGAIDYHLRRGVTLAGFRLGRVERTGDTAFLRARLAGPLGSVAAELYLILDSDRWFVDDIQADWAALQHAQPAPDPIPLPRPHGWSHF
jgi:hypothetical protein